MHCSSSSEDTYIGSWFLKFRSPWSKASRTTRPPFIHNTSFGLLTFCTITIKLKKETVRSFSHKGGHGDVLEPTLLQHVNKELARAEL